jgi:hypothetical protein
MIAPQPCEVAYVWPVHKQRLAYHQQHCVRLRRAQTGSRGTDTALHRKHHSLLLLPACCCCRVFYKEWWNAATLADYWKLWNIPVHAWMLRTLYFPMVRRKWGRWGQQGEAGGGQVWLTSWLLV